VFKKTIEAVKAAEAAAQAELDALFVPYNPQTGEGGVHWHAAGSGILGNAVRGLQGLREELEKRQATIDAAEADAAAQAQQAAAAAATTEDAESVAATQAAIDHAQALGIDIASIKGTGKDGKVTKADVEAAEAAQGVSA
jgi:2-oxoglutarate dehydrogenase E2 component (dihydrolipoamide succinyltransferase)